MLCCRKFFASISQELHWLSLCYNRVHRFFLLKLIVNPAILFCDEPTTGLDAFMAEQVSGSGI